MGNRATHESVFGRSCLRSRVSAHRLSHAAPGRLGGQLLVPPWWIEISTRTSQAANGRYGLTWWVNTRALCGRQPHGGVFGVGLQHQSVYCDPVTGSSGSTRRAGPTDSTENTAPPFIAAIVGP